MAAQQTSLFGDSASLEPEVLIREEGDVRLYRNWWTPGETGRLFQQLQAELAWQQTHIQMHGKRVAVPRLDVWYGDSGHPYRYSGVQFDPLPWSPTLWAIKNELETRQGLTFNSVLANLYRHGQDSVAWHSDDEPELGRHPVIASLSLGAERRFALRHKTRKDIAPVRLDLPSGSLLIMAGATQHYWQHQLSKTARAVGPRINLTFRTVYGPGDTGL
ncbi:alpha-ketoglutarate-dependent dioxygenase AlkB [Marinimicrobium sp. C6131]|uniref:alpha-ketoglutarate-dependent dioxygenase AlkB family protein n=1 Tax=Marinimicrobium sp. C6131 TaxID=3022676 RepID=UPI00223CB621|nr:alpha-ketoglutarate-dependent dioxygenase AlkB [Marinimicrobium sp. C6131]UZJ45369.1 alpha-ketoglutarate-dependent dioxygenase AlkB [Marinimicrobium sp. C6131]